MYCYACVVEGVALLHINSLPLLSSSSPTTCEKEQEEEGKKTY